MKKDVLTTFEASRYLNVAPKTVSNWIDAGYLKAYRTVGGHRRIRREDLEGFISAQQSGRRIRAVAHRKRVLVVDEDAAALETTLRALRELDPPCELESARNGFEAGLKLADSAPDLVILSASLPGTSFAAVCSTIRSRPDTRDSRILAVASQPDPRLSEEMLREGASGCLAKPLDPDQVKRRVVSLLSES